MDRPLAAQRPRPLRHRDASSESLHAFVADAVEPGAVVHTDGWSGYRGLEAKGWRHEVTVLGPRRQAASELMPRVHRVASLLKRWLMGTHQGGGEPQAPGLLP